VPPSGGSSVLVTVIELVDRYGEAIEYDLHAVFNLDLLDFIRGRYRRGKLYRLLSQLPRNSRFRQAQADDEEYAELLLSKFAGTPAPKGPPLGEYTLEAELLTGIGEQLERVVQRLAWLGQDKYRLSPWPRPE